MCYNIFMDQVAKDKLYYTFLKWYAMPEESRSPRTIDEFCQHAKIDKSLIGEFHNRPSYTEDLFKASMEWGKSKVPELLRSLYKHYLDTKSLTHLKMYKELLQLDKPDKSKSDAEEGFSGVLRELFNQSR